MAHPCGTGLFNTLTTVTTATTRAASRITPSAVTSPASISTSATSQPAVLLILQSDFCTPNDLPFLDHRLKDSISQTTNIQRLMCCRCVEFVNISAGATWDIRAAGVLKMQQESQPQLRQQQQEHSQLTRRQVHLLHIQSLQPGILYQLLLQQLNDQWQETFLQQQGEQQQHQHQQRQQQDEQRQELKKQPSTVIILKPKCTHVPAESSVNHRSTRVEYSNGNEHDDSIVQLPTELHISADNIEVAEARLLLLNEIKPSNNNTVNIKDTPLCTEVESPLNLCIRDLCTEYYTTPNQCNAKDNLCGEQTNPNSNKKDQHSKSAFSAKKCRYDNLTIQVENKNIREAATAAISTTATGAVPTSRPSNSFRVHANEVNICKFKFTSGPKPSLRRKRMLSVDSAGNFHYCNGHSLMLSSTSASMTWHPHQRTAIPVKEVPVVLVPSSSTARKGLEENSQAAGTCSTNKHRMQQLKHPARRPAHTKRERLEKAFTEQGFLVQTHQLQSPGGATYCKFRKLNKFSRYLFHYWKDKLPQHLQEALGQCQSRGKKQKHKMGQQKPERVKQTDSFKFD